MSLSEMFVNRSKGLCPFCAVVPGPFRDALSEREFEISGLCQDCQDEFFVEEQPST